jgi:hypothetical protein
MKEASMRKSILAALLVLWFSADAAAQANSKPVIFIVGEGNISIELVGLGAAGIGHSSVVGGSAAHKAINRHDQTMEMAQDLLQFCPAVSITLDSQSAPDYFVSLNREGHPTMFGEIGSSQVMVLNARKGVIFVSKKATVKNAVKSACNAIAADWQANGRLPANGKTAVAESELIDRSAAKLDIALVMRTTERADKYCKQQTITSILSDVTAYLASKGLSLGNVANSNSVLVLIVDRPISKWIQITVQGQDPSGNVLWNEKVTGSWIYMGQQELLNNLDKVHRIIDIHLSKQMLP